MFQFVRNLFKAQAPKSLGMSTSRTAYQEGFVRGRFDAAQSTFENKPLWTMTDYLSARAANSFQVRRTLKIRCGYEVDNSSYLRGIVNRVANDLVGTGPRLQVRTRDTHFNAEVERRWREWAHAIGLGEKLRIMAKAKGGRCGETFGLMMNNETLRRTLGGTLKGIDDAVQLDFLVLESDQCTTPDPGFLDQLWVDGLVLDKLGNPSQYHFLRVHPGDLFVPQLSPLAYDKYSPTLVCHWFRKDRPGQARGVPEITSCVELFALLRRYTRSVITAAEAAAELAIILHTAGPADTTGDPIRPFSTADIERGMMVTVPDGYDVSGFNGTQPATTQEMFTMLILREAARCLDVPLTIALGDYSKSTYSSHRAEHLTYKRTQQIDRVLCEKEVVGKIFLIWYAEAILIPGYLPESIPPNAPHHKWFWDRTDSLDPAKDVAGDAIALKNGTTTLESILGERGEDWQHVMRQRAIEIKMAKELGVEIADPPQPSKPTRGKAGRLPLRAADFKEGDHPRGEDGQFGEGGDEQEERHGKESDTLDKKHAQQHADLDEKHDKERDEHEESGGGDTDTLDDKHAAEKEALDKTHEGEQDAKTARHDAESEALQDAHAGEQEKLTTTHEREAKDQEKAHEREDSALDKKQQREEQKLTMAHDKEDYKTGQQREKDDEKRTAAEGKQDDKIIETREKEDEKLTATRDAQDEARQAKQGKEEEVLEMQIDEDLAKCGDDQAAKDKVEEGAEWKRGALSEKHDAENDVVTDARDLEDTALTETRDEEDTAITDKRDSDAAGREDARNTEDTAREERQSAEKEKLESDQEAERDAHEARQTTERSALEERHMAEAYDLEQDQKTRRSSKPAKEETKSRYHHRPRGTNRLNGRAAHASAAN